MAFYADTAARANPLVLIHSINAVPSAMEVKPLFEHFRSTRPVFAPELPGFGASDRNDRDYTAQFFAESLCDFVDEIGVGKVDVIAMSLSCEFAARAAGLAPQLFRSLSLVSPTGFSKITPMEGAPGARIEAVLRTPVIGPGLYRLLTTKPSIRYFLAKNLDGPVPVEMVEYASKTAHQPGARYAPSVFLSGRLFTPNATASLYAPLQLPGLVIYDQDPNVSFDTLPQFIEEKDNWQIARIAPTKGLPHFEKLDRVVAALDGFWGNPVTAPTQALLNAYAHHRQ